MEAPHVFGTVGDGIAGLIEAVRKRVGQTQYVGVRHEEAAAFMASGYAKLTGKLGVCLGTTVILRVPLQTELDIGARSFPTVASWPEKSR